MKANMGEVNKMSKKSKAVKCNQAQRLFISSLQSKERPYFGSAIAWFKLHAHFPLNVNLNELDKITLSVQIYH